MWDPLAVFEAVRAANSVPQVVSHVRHVQKSGLKVPDLENHTKNGENGPKRAENDADDVAGASEAAVEHLEDADGAQGPAQTHADVVDDVLAADTGPMSLRKVRKVVLPSFENRKTNHNKSS